MKFEGRRKEFAQSTADLVRRFKTLLDLEFFFSENRDAYHRWNGYILFEIVENIGKIVTRSE